jgi:hypothetical protein
MADLWMTSHAVDSAKVVTKTYLGREKTDVTQTNPGRFIAGDNRTTYF